MREKYLFVRILEACNANCFMCDFALSKDRYRFTPAELSSLLVEAERYGVTYVRLTGGEPLIHPDICELVEIISSAGMKSSIITNGSALPSRINALAESGLYQIIVSIDGLDSSHDDIRGFAGLFNRCAEGLTKAKTLGVRTRVNTVVGPHNYRDMPALQRILTDLGVDQWELSAIKLDRHIAYRDRQDVITVCEPIYKSPPGLLVPTGHRFYGETREAQNAFFNLGTCPKPSGQRCNLMGDVIYIDPKLDRAFGCSLLPHRTGDGKANGAIIRTPGGAWSLNSSAWLDHVSYYASTGHRGCKGCSTTAAGYSDAVDSGEELADLAF